MKKVKVYSTHTCPWCAKAAEYLKKKGIPFDHVYIEDTLGAHKEMLRLSGQEGVPVIVIGDEVIVGFDREAIDAALGT